MIFRYFQNGDRPPSWIYYEHVWTAHRVCCGLYHCTKFRWNRRSSFDNMQVLIFNEFGLKMSIQAGTPPNWSFFGEGLYPINGKQPYRDPQRTPPCAETRHRTYGKYIDR